jgi:hypothetical protein
MQLVIEYINGSKLMIYSLSSSLGGHRHFYTEPFVYFNLQTTLEDKILLQVCTEDDDLVLNLNQEEALFFLENLLEFKGYYTCCGAVPCLSKKEIYCSEIYIDIKDRIQEIWDLRERILYWVSYGNIGEDFNEVSS